MIFRKGKDDSCFGSGFLLHEEKRAIELLVLGFLFGEGEEMKGQLMEATDDDRGCGR